MTKEEILKADLLDILFENRNKAYGAYDLRKHYNFRLSMALAIAVTGAFISFLILRPGNDKTSIPIFNVDDTVVLVDLKTEPEKPLEEPEEIQPQPKLQEQPPASIRNVPIEIVNDNLVDNNTIPTQDDMVDKIISNVTTQGPPATGIITPPLNMDGNGKATEPEPEEDKIYEGDVVEHKPEFPGGLDALRNFLSRYLRHPDELEENEVRTVYVKFVVSKDGSVTDYQVIRSAGKNFDNEVLRVLKKMPKWKPAKQRGKNVAVTFTQPVTFKGVEY